tara:strand:+ start:281 stop:1120 length:840 start_codon:yes stop_codon:yes gene_type:complete
MKEFKLLCDTFIHLTNGNKGYTTHGKESKYIKWIHEGEGKQQITFNNLSSSDETFYVDRFVPTGLQDKVSGKKYAIILECCWLVQPLINDIKNKLDIYLNEYEKIFTWSEELVNLHERICWIPGSGSWIREPQIYPKSELVSIIASNKSHLQGHQQRLHMIDQLKEYAPLFGRGFNEIEFKEEALANYMFSVAIENADNWFTEKLLDCFLTGTIPIYYGTPSVGKWFNTDGIIFLEDGFDIESLSKDLYLSKMDAIKENFEKAKEMEVVEDFIWKSYFE